MKLSRQVQLLTQTQEEGVEANEKENEQFTSVVENNLEYMITYFTDEKLYGPFSGTNHPILLQYY